jgi:glyoxylase-like metal-dependent hydrolase (beta-lactamase superfamily II)
LAIVNTRVQNPVGQGFFHTAALYEDDALRLSYVYDCGAMQRYATERQRQITNHLKHVGARSPLDILFISHIHADHLNGLEQLLDRTHGLHVDTIVLPLVDVTDRLIAFARTVAKDSASAQSSFYRAFIVDPSEALGRFRPRQVIFVEPGDRDNGAPDGDERPFDSPEGPEVFGDGGGEHGPTWKLVGRGHVRPLDVTIEHGQADGQFPMRFVIPDTLAMLTSAPQGAWLLAPFVDPTIMAHRKKFLEELAKQCKMSRPKLDAWLKVTANVQQLLTTDLDRLAAAYEVVTGDLNISSLCLYSGPACGLSKNLLRCHHGEFGCVRTDNVGPQSRIAWLATGDAALQHKRRR